MKTCVACGDSWPLDLFIRDARRPDGRGSRCKACHALLKKPPNPNTPRCERCGRKTLHWQPDFPICHRTACRTAYLTAKEPLSLPTSCCGARLEYGTMDGIAVEWCRKCGMKPTPIRGTRTYDQRAILEAELSGQVSRATDPTLFIPGPKGTYVPREGAHRGGKMPNIFVGQGPKWGVGGHPFNQKRREEVA